MVNVAILTFSALIPLFQTAGTSTLHEKCSSELVIKIGDYSYVPIMTNIFCYIPADLEYDNHDNLFAILEDHNEEYPFKAYVLKKKSIDFKLIEGLDESIAVQDLAFDRVTKKMYFATENGIYIYMLTTSLDYELVKFTCSGKDIYNIEFDKNGVAYIGTYKNYRMYTLGDDQEKIVFNRVPNATYFRIDCDNNVYYVYDDIFYVLWSDEYKPQKITQVNEIGHKAIAFDAEGNGYLAYSGGLLYMKYGTKTFMKANDMFGAATAVAVDSHGNLALGYRKKMFKFVKIGKC